VPVSFAEASIEMGACASLQAVTGDASGKSLAKQRNETYAYPNPISHACPIKSSFGVAPATGFFTGYELQSR